MTYVTVLSLLLAIVAGQTAELPPPFPRPGTTALLENDIVAVWDVSWLKQKYPLHTHRYDLVGISYVEGDRIITQGEAPGRLVNTKPWVFQTNRANVTHVEEGASDPPMRAVLIEVKPPAPRAAAEDPADGLRKVLGAPAWDSNNRAAAWVIMGGASGAAHRHVGDAVELVFDPSADAQGVIRAGGNGSLRPDAGRRRPGVHLRAQIERTYGQDEQRSACFPGDLRDGRRRRGPAAGSVRAGGGQRQAGVEPVRAAHHRAQSRLRPRKPVRQDPHEPGDLGLRRSG